MSRPSNGTMGHLWMDRWCYRCVNDHEASHGPENYENGCELLLWLFTTRSDETRPEFVSHERAGHAWSPDDFECRMFERCPCQDERGWEPPVKPKPDPNQGLLFEVIDETPFTPMVVIPVGEEAAVSA